MDRPEQPKRSEPESIFSTPDPYGDPTPPVQPVPPPPDAEGTLGAIDVSTWKPPAPPEGPVDAPRAAGPRPPSGNGGDGLSRRTIIALASAGVLALLVISFVAFSILGADDPPPVAADDESPTTAASASAEPTSDASPGPTATPEPTPEPTPAGPPVELAVGGWATVSADELNVRGGAGEGEPSTYSLVRGAVVSVAEGPTVIDGHNWYRFTSLGGVTGWSSSGGEEDPYLEIVAEDPRLSECGQVRRPVFDSAGGTPVPVDPLRIGAFALPVSSFDDVSLAAMELSRGMGHEVCFSARLLANGLPELSTELNASACGHATYDGSVFRLEPTGDDSVPLASQVIESTLLHPVLLRGGAADDRMSSNFRTIAFMLTNDGTSGCINTSATQRGDATDSHRSISAVQCSRINQYNEFSLKLSPASGGPEAFIKLPGGGYVDREGLPLDRKIPVSVDASIDNGGEQYAGAWRYHEGCG